MNLLRGAFDLLQSSPRSPSRISLSHLPPIRISFDLFLSNQINISRIRFSPWWIRFSYASLDSQ